MRLKASYKKERVLLFSFQLHTNLTLREISNKLCPILMHIMAETLSPAHRTTVLIHAPFSVHVTLFKIQIPLQTSLNLVTITVVVGNLNPDGEG